MRRQLSAAARARVSGGRRYLIAAGIVVAVALLVGCGGARTAASSADTALAGTPAVPGTLLVAAKQPTRLHLPAKTTAPKAPSTHPEPRVVQKRLAALGYLPAKAVTGVWDARTAHAVLAFQAWQGLARDGIVGPKTLAALEKARRPQPASSASRRHVEVHRQKGVTLLVERGRVVRALHSSSGAGRYTTPAGSFSIFRKELNSWSVPYRVWLPYASYFNGGIAFHGYSEVPAYPASHGCVRLPIWEAPFAYAFMSVGTHVAVH